MTTVFHTWLYDIFIEKLSNLRRKNFVEPELQITAGDR